MQQAPGECTALPQRTWNATVHARAVNNHGQHHSSDITWQLKTSRLYDVEGDGVLDTFVPLHGRGQCPEQGLWPVYVMRGSCGHPVGTVGPGWLGSELASTPPTANTALPS